MANIKIAGRSATIVSVYTLEDLEKVAKYRPDALLLKDEDGDVEFAVMPTCKGSVSEIGVGFGDETFGDGKACVTVTPTCNCYENAEDFVLKEIGTAILNLNKVEKQIPAALDEIDAELAAIKDAIEVV